jgi:4-amino-4-deoxy-L-arabinose transferase-like glycosyltransferase
MEIPASTDTHEPPTARTGFDLAWLAIAFGALFFVALGNRPLANPDEARYAEIPREMIATGDWVMPRLNDTFYFEKPPLVYWMGALCRQAFGPRDWAMRLPSAIFALAGVFFTYLTARSVYGRTTGLLSAIVLGTSLLYFGLGQILLLDAAVSVLMTATLFCFILGVREPSHSAGSGQAGMRRRWLFYGLYAAAALATLAKGLIGFLIPGAVMFIWLLVFNQWHRLRPLYLPTGIVLFLLIAAPWHILAAQRHPEWAQFYFVHEHWNRFTTTAHDRTEPWWFFAPVIVVGLFPWVGFLPAALREPLAGGWTQRKQNADAWFLITWVAFVFLFFSKSQSKLIPYILPVFPPLAMLIGAWLARRIEEGNAAKVRMGMGVFAFGSGLLTVAVLAVVFRSGVIRDPAQALALRPFAIGIAAILVIGGIAAPWAAKVHSVAAGLTTLIATALGFAFVIVSAAPNLQRASTKELALIARERMRADDRVFHYWAFFHDFVYYSERPVGLVSYLDELEVQFLSPAERAERFIDDTELRRRWAGPQRLWVVVRKRDQANSKSVFADAAFRNQMYLIAETPAHSLLSNRP